MKPSIATKPQVVPLKQREHYDGAELQPFAGRIGAMDAFALPSMVNGDRVARKTPILNSETKK